MNEYSYSGRDPVNRGAFNRQIPKVNFPLIFQQIMLVWVQTKVLSIDLTPKAE